MNLGSSKGAQRNRLGHNGGLAVAFGFMFGRPLIQYLHLRGTTLCNEEVEFIADAL